MTSRAVASRRDLTAYFVALDPTRLPLATSGDGLEARTRLRRDEALVEFDVTAPARGDLPSRIVVHEDDVDDFFAWASTFVEGLRPFTAFIPVLSRLQALNERRRGHMPRRAKQGLIACVLMDGLLQSRSPGRIPETILPACQRTLSAVLYQTNVLGCAGWEVADAAGLWAQIRSILNAPELIYDTQLLLEFWGRIFSAFNIDSGDPDGLSKTVRAGTEAGNRDVFWQADLLEVLPDTLDRFLKAPREDRLRFVDQRIVQMSQGREKHVVVNAYAGYLLSLVADGDFGLWPTAARYQMLRSAPMWFALFTGMNENSNVLDFGQSIGRRLSTMLEEQDGTVDIDAREFVVSGRARTTRGTAVDFPLAAQHVMAACLGVGVRGWFPTREVAPVDERRVTPRDAQAASTGQPSTKDIVDARLLAERIVNLLSSPPRGGNSTPHPPAHSEPPPQATAPSGSSPTRDRDEETSTGQLPLDVGVPPRGPSSKKNKKRS